MNDSKPTRCHLLLGLKAPNPLAALTAFGTLRVLSGVTQAQMDWTLRGSQWRPRLHFPDARSQEQVVALLYQALQVGEDAPEFTMNGGEGKPRNNLSKLSPDEFRDIASYAIRAIADDTSEADRMRRLLAFCAGYGTDAVDPEEDEAIADTALRTMSGAGHQHFLGFMRQIVATTSREHLRSALYERWTYSDDKPSMRWDPHDDRRRALMAIDPSRQVKGNEIRTMRGANRLAIEALPLFRTVPFRGRARTTGFWWNGSKRATLMRWPIWDVPLDLMTVQSLMVHPKLMQPEPDMRHLARINVPDVYEARRISEQYFRNFSLGRSVAR